MSNTKYRFSKLIVDDLLEPAEFNVQDMFNRTAAILEIFDWCDELGVVMTFGFSKQFDEYFFNLNIDKWYKTVYISRDVLTQGRTPYIHDLILNAVKELKLTADEDEKGE